MPEPYRERPPIEGDDEVVTIAAHQSTVEAEMARAYLGDHGIKAFVHDAASFNPLVSVAAGGARVLVRGADEARARSLLVRLARMPTGEGDDDDGEGEVRCPRCEQTYCFQGTALSGEVRAGAVVGPALALLLLPLGLSRKRWRCHKCLHVWDDPHEGPAKRTPLHPDDPRPVFRLRRHRGGSGLAAGVALMFLLWLFAATIALPGVTMLLGGLAFLLPIAGYAVGRKVTTDVCSSPGCRAELRPGVEDCPMCRGAVAGVIHAANEHHSEAAEVRRELAAVRAEEAEKAEKPNPKAKSTSKKRLPR